MGRPRKHGKHLPANMMLQHGAYYFVKSGKWHRLGKDYGPALVEYARLVGSAPKVTTVKDAMWAAIEAGRTRKHKKPLAKATLEGYMHSATRLDKVFGPLALDEIDSEMVVKYVITAGTVQANRDKALLSIAYTHARVMAGYRGPDPTKGLQTRVEETPRDRYVSDGELAVALNAASPKLACIMRFLYLTGMRQGDALALKMTDLDDEGFTYWNSKGKKWQGLEWSGELTECVEEAKRLWRRFGRVWLFESNPKGKHAKRGVGPYTPSGLRSLWGRTRLKTGLQDITLHDLRGKAGSDAGTDAEAQHLLGHSDSKVTRRHYRRKVVRSKPAR